MPNWTVEQQDAIESRNKNLLVSAGAGSGKTAVLVERIIRLVLDDKVDIDRLLIVTFTNAAAGEMRERILKALMEKLKDEDSDTKFIREQINRLNRSYIMTLHSFCMTVVRNNFQIIDIDPGFRIGDTNDLNIMISETIDDLLEVEYEKGDPIFEAIVESYSENRSDKKLGELILDVYRFIQSAPYPMDWLENAISEMIGGAWTAKLKEYIELDLRMCSEMIEDAMDISAEPDGPTEYDENLDSDIMNIDKLQKALDNGIRELEAIAGDIKHSRLKTIKKARKEEVDPQKMAHVKALRDNYKKMLKSSFEVFTKKSLDEYEEELAKMEPVLRYLAELIRAFSDTYTKKKQDKTVLDFNDLEHYGLKALESEEVCRHYREKFEYIFVDEYQDSNLVQETLINRIKRENNLFLVGDVKQSIYKFRLADSSIFLGKYNTYKTDDSSIDKRIDLNRNFRSRKDVLDFINFLFERLMSERFGEIEYDESVYLTAGMPFKEIDEMPVEVSIIYEDKEKASTRDVDEALQELSSVEAEAKYIAERIKGMLGTKSYSGKRGDYADVTFKDIVILLRAVSSSGEVYQEIFNKEGIPLYLDNQSGYFDSIEIKMILDLLRLVDNKRQDVPLISVLRSPIGRFTVDEMIDVRLHCRQGTYYEALETCAENEDALGSKVNAFLESLNKWKEQSKYMNLDEFIWMIIEETDYFDYVGAMPGGKLRQGNLRLLVERAAQLSQSRMSSLYDFIKVMEKMKKAKGDFGTAKVIGENENVVRLMSIHKSKGLEFPIVFVAGMGKKFNLRDTYKDIILHKELGLGPKYVDFENRIFTESLPRVLIKKTMKHESLSEEMRILYVALTRAVDRLILVGSEKNVQKRIETWLKGARLYNLLSGQTFMDWTCSIMSEHGVGNGFNLFAELGQKSYVADQYKINFVERSEISGIRFDSDEAVVHDVQGLLVKIDGYGTVGDELKSALEWEYPKESAYSLPSKVSVTEIKNLEVSKEAKIKVPELAERPKFLMEETKLTGAEIGNLMHLFMQSVKIEKAGSMELLSAQLKEMVERGVYSESESEYVNLEKINNFFRHDLGKRTLTAEKVYREKAFVLRKKLTDSEEEVLVQGIIDCFFVEKDGIVLMDYKTDYVGSFDEKTLLNRYKKQLELYKEAIERITGQKVKETYIYSFSRNKALEVI